MNTADSRGTIVQGRTVWRINNALVEEVHTSNGRTGHLIVSYAVHAPGGLTMIELLRLNVNGSTLVVNQLWMPFCLCDLRPGMWIDAAFSPAMTRSIPPQTNAFRIVVLRGRPNPLPPQPPRPQPPRPQPPRPQPPRPQPPRPQPPQLSAYVTTTDRVAGVDIRNNFLLTGNPFDMNQQMRFVVSNETVISDRQGNRIPLRMIRPGQLVEVTHASFQTASIPPQSPAYRVQVLSS